MSIKITSDFARNSASDTYSLMDILTVKGGFSSFPDSASLWTGLPKPVRSDNMLAYTADNRSFYELINNPNANVTTASDWDILTIGVAGGVNIQGVLWNASANTGPVLNDNTGTSGHFYICATAGTVSDVNIAAANGTTFVVGDWIMFDGTSWRKLAQSGNAGNWNTLANKPSTFSPSIHTHSISEVINLQTDLNSKETLLNKIQTLTSLNANKTSTAMYASLNALVDYIAQEITAAGTGGSGTTDHELLTNLNGGITNEHYHFSAAQHTKLLKLIYTAPTIRFNGTTALKMGNNNGTATEEVGESFTINKSITSTFTELLNITPAATWELELTPAAGFNALNTTSSGFISAYVNTPIGSGIHKISQGRIRELTSSGTNNVLVAPTVYTYVQTMHKIFYFIYDSSVDFLISANNGTLQTHLNTIKSNNNVSDVQYHQLRAGKFTGNLTFDEPGISPVYMYMVAPDSYGSNGFAPQAFPSSPIPVASSTFTYVNGGASTTYKIQRLNGTPPELGQSGKIDLIIT
jgi:hypothetical protein